MSGRTDAANLELTPLRAHYLKRELVALQLGHELEGLGDVPDALALLGPPFNAPKDDGTNAAKPDLIFLRFFFHAFVREFPFLKPAPATFFSQKVQPFIASFLARNMTTSDDRDEETKRKRLAGKLEKHFGLLLSSAVKLSDNGGQEEVIRVTPQGPLATPVGEDVLPSVPALKNKDLPPLPTTAATANKDFEVNVVTIRVITTKGRLRNKSHEEFVIQVKRKGKPDSYVSRRYGDFTRLAEKLRSEFPDQDVRPPPAKDRRTSETKSGSTPPSPQHGSTNSPRNSAEYASSVASFAGSPPMSPPNPYFAGTGSPNSSSRASPAPVGQQKVVLARERNRLTLRAYIRHLLNTPNVNNSSTLRDFLLTDPIQLTQSEMMGVEVRMEMDRVREEEMSRFRSEVDERVKELEQHLRWFREELVKRDGLRRVFGTIKTVPKVEGLPVEYRKVLEWARISLASTIYQLFVGSDNSSSTFQQLKRMHGLMPYFMLRGILRISNPVAMIRGVLDLFLARPFGQSSLLQRMLGSGLTDEVRELKEDMELVAAKVPFPSMVEKVKAYVNAPREIQKFYKQDAKDERMDLMSIILRSSEEPQLEPSARAKLAECDRAYQEYTTHRDTLDDPEDDEGPTNDDAWLYEDLHVYLRIAQRARDKEQMVELIFEGATSELLKDMVTIFYQPLAQVYKAANIAQSLSDLQVFLDDLIKTVEHAENASVSDPQRTVQTFIDLVGRHEGSFYAFVHNVHTKGSQLFDDLMIWMERIINFVRDGLPEPVSLDFLLPAGPTERTKVLAEVDAIVEYHRKLKEAHHERMRRRMVRGEVQEVDQDRAFVDGVMKNMDLGTITGDVEEMAAAESDEEADPDDASSEEHFDDASENLAHDDPTIAHIQRDRTTSDAARSEALAKPKVNKRKKKKDRVVLEPPRLVHLPQISLVFTELIRPGLEASLRQAQR